MFYDLNLPYDDKDINLSRKLHFLAELGYNVVALNHIITGKLPNELSCSISNPLPITDLPSKLDIKRRATLVLTDHLQNSRLNALAQHYDIFALRPVDEKTLQLACVTYDCDIISLDLSQRFGFHFRLKMFSEAIKSGKRIEICYAQGLLVDAMARRNLIQNATQLIRATRGRGLIITSEAKSALACRGPWDVINLAAVWGLGQERGHEALAKEARGIVVRAGLKRSSYRGVIAVIHPGEEPVGTAKETDKPAEDAKTGQKRKLDQQQADNVSSSTEKPLSNTQKKKRARLAAQQAAKAGAADQAVT